jgi:hypothetical protein
MSLSVAVQCCPSVLSNHTFLGVHSIDAGASRCSGQCGCANQVFTHASPANDGTATQVQMNWCSVGPLQGACRKDGISCNCILLFDCTMTLCWLVARADFAPLVKMSCPGRLKHTSFQSQWCHVRVKWGIMLTITHCGVASLNLSGTWMRCLLKLPIEWS